MFRDEGAGPSIEFRRRMQERVERTPTGVVILAIPFLAVARLILIGRGIYLRSRCVALCEKIDNKRDLRSITAR